ncbi:hypothetical protein Tco_1484470 [Tanacetum coccineum]
MKKRRPRRGDDFSFHEAMVKANFWLLWTTYFLGIGTGVTDLNNLAQIGSSLSFEDTNTLLSLFSFCNFLGRLGRGVVSEYFVSLTFTFVFITVADHGFISMYYGIRNGDVELWIYFIVAIPIPAVEVALRFRLSIHSLDLFHSLPLPRCYNSSHGHRIPDRHHPMLHRGINSGLDVPGPEEPEQASLSPDYMPGPEYPEYLASFDKEEDSKDSPVDYPANGGDGDDDDSSDDDEEEEVSR